MWCGVGIWVGIGGVRRRVLGSICDVGVVGVIVGVGVWVCG